MKMYPDVRISDETFKSINQLKSQLLELGELTGDTVSAVLGVTAYHGREGIVKREERMFNFGASYSKKDGDEKRKRTTKYGREGYVIIGKTTSKGSPYRLVQYSFENVHSMRSRNAFTRSVRECYISSKMLNLFEHDTKPYKNKSPWIHYDGESRFRIPKGYIRRGRGFYMDEYGEVEKAIPNAIAKVEYRLQKEIDDVTR